MKEEGEWSTSSEDGNSDMMVVGRAPRRIVPPITFWLISGINTTTGWGVAVRSPVSHIGIKI